MEPIQREKDVTIKGQRYQITKLPATISGWLAVQIATKMLPAFVESKLKIEGLSANRSEISESEFHNVQNHCLSACKKYEVVGQQDVPQPILVGGKWVFKDLEYDVVTVLGLTVQALLFNIDPFFQDGGLEELLKDIPGLSRVNPPQ